VTGQSPAGLGRPLRIELVSGGLQAEFDNVRLEAVPLPIPEPGSLLLLVSGLAGLICCIGRRSRR
jgi:hypothetical protein